MSQKPTSNQGRFLIINLAFITIILFMAALLFLFYNGILQINNPSKKKYPIRGVDVSSYQGDIDWNVLSEEGIRFAFIKATEGSSFQDAHFQTNWEYGGQTDLKVGAYHFFSYDSSGETQAENFIKTVGEKEGMLPPVVDVEFYGDKEENPPPASEVKENLYLFMNKLEDHYGMKPIIYTTLNSYDLYIKDDFLSYDIWIRNVYNPRFGPLLSDGRRWTFWQYSNRKVLKGYNGTEKFIDINLFWGSEEDFLRYPNKE